MAEVKLIGAIRRVNGVFHDFGAIVDLPSEQAKRLLDLGVAVDPKADLPSGDAPEGDAPASRARRGKKADQEEAA